MKKEKVKLLRSSLPLFDGIAFLERFSNRGVFILLFLLLICGVFVGSAVTVGFGLFEGRSVFPLFFSGIPSPETGFLSCFTTLLLNVLICLIVLFLLGVTAFGVLAVPVFVFLKGITVGIGALSFFFSEGLLSGLGQSALYYIPATAAASLLILFFGVRSLVFSDRLAKVSFSAHEGSLDFNDYFKDFLLFLTLAVAASLAGSLPAALYAVFLP